MWIPEELGKDQVQLIFNLLERLGVSARPYMDGAFLLILPGTVSSSDLAMAVEALNQVFTAVELHIAQTDRILYRITP